MEVKSNFDWQFDEIHGVWYVVEHEGMLRTGPFISKERAREWFKEELEIELGESQP